MNTRTILAIIVAVIVIGSVGYYVYIGGFAPKRELSVKGSTTVLPFAQAAAESYLNTHVNDEISVSGGGSGVGIAALIDGTTDIAMASRSIKQSEIDKANAGSVNPVEYAVALDALSIVVHPSNPVSQLTIEQVRRIYKGEITNWNEVGGPDSAIVIYERETTSGTYEVFEERIMSKQPVTTKALSTASNGEMRQKVSQNTAAIGYVGLAYLGEDLKGLNLAKDAGSPYIAPTKENARNGSYPVVRTLYMYTNGPATGAAKDFLDFILSSEGQQIAEEVGYIALP